MEITAGLLIMVCPKKLDMLTVSTKCCCTRNVKRFGIKEASIYCFTQDNTKRPSIQKQAFFDATVALVFEIVRRGAALLVVGDKLRCNSPLR